jgi:DNA-binding NtrC family response regulator
MATDHANADGQLTVLIADDDPAIVTSGKFLFRDEGWKVLEARSPSEAVRQVEKNECDVALVDMNYARNTTGGAEGLDLISRIHEMDPDLPVVVMTAWGTIDLAINAMKSGAADFVQKPWENARVVQQIRAHGTASRALRRNRLLEEENQILRGRGLPEGFVCNSSAMRQVVEIVDQVAPSRASILLLGENGTGKGVVARMIHEKSPLHEGPFISVNMGGLPENLFESEMFGHVKGAFTDAKTDRAGRFELAKGGTLFLDEIGNMTPAQQGKILRVLETGEYERVGSSRTLKADVRIVSATNTNLRAAVQAGTFREDLFFRLNTVTVDLPPLRDRKDDILALAESFIHSFGSKYHKTILDFEKDAEEELLAHDWPGNIRELRHAMERAVLLCKGNALTRRDIGLQRDNSAKANLDSMSIEDVERVLIQKALHRNEGNVTKAAEQLGMSRATFYRRLKSFEK